MDLYTIQTVPLKTRTNKTTRNNNIMETRINTTSQLSLTFNSNHTWHTIRWLLPILAVFLSGYYQGNVQLKGLNVT